MFIKFVLTVLIAVGAWFGFRHYKTLKAAAQKAVQPHTKASKHEDAPVLEMDKCPKCGAYHGPNQECRS